jgi:hypothetical protein
MMISQKLYIKVLVCIVIALLIISPVSVSGQSVVLVSVSPEIFENIAHQHFWQLNRSAKTDNIDDVNAYLNSINQGQYSDWRLPTKEELFQLHTAFDLKRNGDLQVQLEGNYWLVDYMGKAYVGTWEIGDQCGPSRAFYKGNAGYIRAIRP